VFGLPQLKSLVQISLQLLLQSIHLICLFLHQLSFTREDLLLSIPHVLLSLLLLLLLTNYLDLMRLGILSLFCQVLLNFLLI
jgi:hypothetical protein